MQNERLNETVQLSDLIRQLCRRWRTFVLVVVLTILAAAGVFPLVGSAYTAKAVLTVSPITTSPFASGTGNQDVNITTERAILGSPEVARMAAAKLDASIDPVELSRNVEIAAPQGSQVLEVSVTSSDAKQAALRANALADSYLDFRSLGAEDIARNFIDVLNEQIASLEDEDKRANKNQIAEMRSQRTGLSLVAENPGRIIGYAVASEAKSSFGLPVYLAGGLFGGFVLGLLAVALRERFDRRVGFPDKLVECTSQVASIVSGTDRDEVLRKVLRTLDISPRSARTGLAAVGILELPPRKNDRFTAGLVGVAHANNVQCVVISSSDITPETVDSGWPWMPADDAWPDADALLLELNCGLGGTRLAELSDRLLESLVVVVDGRTLRSDVRSMLEGGGSEAPENLVFVFLERPQRSWANVETSSRPARRVRKKQQADEQEPNSRGRRTGFVEQDVS